MKRNVRRILGASVSVLALAPVVGVAAPVPGVDDTVSPAPSVSLELELSDIDHGPVFGISDGPSVNVDDVSEGEIQQYGSATGVAGVADLLITNVGDVTIRAIATNDGTAYADATLETAVFQSALANSSGGVAVVALENSGSLKATVQAVADSSSANAQAYLEDYGVYQYAEGVASASVSLKNSSALEVSVEAVAIGSTYDATAEATMDAGIYQSADSEGAASVELDNTGSLTLATIASATAYDDADAEAYAYGGIEQRAHSGEDSGTVSLVNGVAGAAADAQAAIEISVAAVAKGETAEANAYNKYAIDQSARADNPGNAASVAIANNGALAITALATASAGYEADAYASVSSAIEQSAVSWDGAASKVALGNNGSLTISAKAIASASEYADATAYNQYAIDQYAETQDGGTASVAITNTGSLNVITVADAIGTDVYAYANAVSAIEQSADAEEGSASVALTNGSSGAINLLATANATGTYEANAVASNEYGIAQEASAENAGNVASASLTNDGAITLFAGAVAKADDAYAYAELDGGVYQDADGDEGADAIALTSNVGSLDILAQADATGVSDADARAYNYYALSQEVSSEDGGLATAQIDNSGAINVAAVANAIATDAGATEAYAYAKVESAIVQDAEAEEGSATASLTNASSGAITIAATAVADGADYATASASVEWAIGQYASAELTGQVANVTLTNDGTITIAVDAKASAEDAYASASIDYAVYQDAEGDDGADAVAAITNTGTLNVTAVAAAVGGTSAEAKAYYYSGITQYAEADGGGNAAVTLDNVGTLNFTATADATGDDAYANAWMDTAIYQNADADGGTASVQLTNSGTVNFTVDAAAVGDGTGTAYATIEQAIHQSANGADGSAVTFTNTATGVVNVNAVAVATADDADAYAGVWGLEQQSNVDGAKFTVNNAGTFNAVANAVANGATYAEAQATASAIYINSNGETGLVDVANSGVINVAATAGANDLAEAHAWGLGVDASEGEWSGAVSGTIDNSGTVKVVAKADAKGSDASYGGYAEATAVWVDAGSNNISLTNSGTIQADAVTDAGGSPYATGVGIWGGSGDDQFTLTNAAGNIIARKSTDLGATYTWGTAIRTDQATTPALLNWQGNGVTYSGVYPNVALTDAQFGYIYGNVEIKNGDEIVVSKGETWFDGTINVPTPDYYPDSIEPAAIYIAPADGALTIANDGLLFLLDDRYDFVTGKDYSGPSKVNVDTFTIEGKGVLAMHLPTVGASAVTAGDHPQVFANTVNLDPDGKGNEAILEVRQASANGLYDDHYRYEDVVVALSGAEGLTGKFAQVRTQSVLLSAKDDYSDNDGTIDLDVTRVGFGNVAGLNINQTAVGDGIEGTYAPTLTGPYAGMLSSLFTIANEGEYALALDQLSADLYAGYLRSATMAGARFNGLIYDMAECGKGSITNELCRSENGGPRIWLTGNYGRVDTDGDAEASGFKADQYYIAAGVDFAVSPNFVLGVAGAYLENNLEFDLYNGKIDSNGWQAGIYANHDTGKYYLKGAISYSDLDGDSSRMVGFGQTPGFNNGRPFGGTITGDPDVNVWAAGAEAGVRFPLGENATITPYASLDYAHAKLKRFTEQGLPGANLTVRGSDEFFASELGVELAAQWGNVAPYIRGGWQHNFGDKRAKFTGAFVDAPAGTSFDVISERFAPDAGVVEVGLAAQFSPNFNAHLGYQGRFSSNVEEHTGGLTLSYLFGGAEPAAPPPPAPPAPPPPAPPQVVCNKGPYIVFFDWDKSDITPEAATILDSAVTAYGNCDVVPIMLAGYTDRSGSDRYNMGLSARRNTSVRGYLTSRGIPDERISSQAFGEANPRVPTADGVRELQNRRVEITYGPGSGE